MNKLLSPNRLALSRLSLAAGSPALTGYKKGAIDGKRIADDFTGRQFSPA